MLKIKDKNNRRYISKYINEKNAFDNLEKLVIEESTYFLQLENILGRYPVEEQRKLMGALINTYSLKEPLWEIFQKYTPEVGSELLPDIPTNLQRDFDELVLSIAREVMGCDIYDGRVKFNHKKFAEFVLKTYRLAIDKKDPDVLLVYNNQSGIWDDATHPLKRLIIEIAYYIGEGRLDTWNSILEKAIMDILSRKVKLIETKHFNQQYFPLGNVTLDSITGDIVPHSTKHLATMGSPIVYDSSATCTQFTTFVDELFEDSDTIAFVQEWFGYVLSNSQKANSLLIGVGTGANGKSTLFDVLTHLVGLNNVASITLSNFNTDFGIEPLIGMKLNLATESDVDSFKTGKIKAITAGENISVNRKNKPEITISLPTKLIFLVNELPILSDSSMGFERRLIILPFEKTFTPDKQDKDLPVKLGNELPGILNWALQGLSRLIANDYKFTVSSPMKEAKSSYIGTGNPVERFVREYVNSKPGNTYESREVFTAYKNWMKTNQLPFKGTDSVQTFWSYFEQAASKNQLEYKKSKSNGKVVVRDIEIKNN